MTTILSRLMIAVGTFAFVLLLLGTATAQNADDLNFDDLDVEDSGAAPDAVSDVSPKVAVDTSANAKIVPQITIPPIATIDRSGVEEVTEKYADGKAKRTYDVKVVDGVRVKHGNFVENYPSGARFIFGQYRNGAPHGEWKYFHENGAIAKTGIYVDGKMYGKWEVKQPNGALIREDSYEGGKQHGLEIVYFTDGRSHMFERMYLNGIPNGTWMAWYRPSTMLHKIEFKDGRKHGEMVQWFPNGNVHNMGTYKNGERDGVFQSYSQAGAKTKETRWQDGKRVSVLSGAGS